MMQFKTRHTNSHIGLCQNPLKRSLTSNRSFNNLHTCIHVEMAYVYSRLIIVQLFVRKIATDCILNPRVFFSCILFHKMKWFAVFFKRLRQFYFISRTDITLSNIWKWIFFINKCKRSKLYFYHIYCKKKINK